MAIYQIEQIAKDVRIALDENHVSDQLVETADIDTLTLDEIIRSKIVEAVKRVETDAPTHMLDGGYNFGDAVYWGSKCSGHVLLPRDFMRLIVFKMTDWERAVYTAISTDDPDYEKQSSRFKGIRGTAQRPVCAIVFRPEGLALEFYSCKSESAQVAQAVYLPEPKIDDAGGIDICRRCYTAVVYTAASLTLLTFGASDKSNALSEIAKSYIQ